MNESLKAQGVSTFLSKGQRPAQEDYVLADRIKGIFVVADGFGGAVPGAEAAKNACESIRSFLFKQAGDLEATLPFVLRNYFSLAGNVLFNSMIYANHKLNAANRSKNVHEKGGASVLAAFIDGDLLALANVGTCTAWLMRDGKMVELVVPRGLGRLCDPFALECPETHRVPLMALGMTEDLEPEIFEYKIRKKDWILINSDGVSTDTRQGILQLQQKQLNAEQAIKEVNQLLNSGKYDDNASVSLAII